MPPLPETPRVRFNPLNVISHIASSFHQVPTSEPQLYRDEPPRSQQSASADVVVPVADEPIFTQSANFPKRQRMRHKSEASPRRATQSDSAMAQPALEKTERRQRHSSSTSERHILRHTWKQRMSGLNYQNADVCGQIQVMCAVISIIIELMLLIHFNLPHHFRGLGFIAGTAYFLGGALGLSTAQSKQKPKCILLCMVISMISVIMAVYVAVGALNGLLTLNQTVVEAPLVEPPIYEDDLLGADYMDHHDDDDYLAPDAHGDDLDHFDGAMDYVESADVTINQLLYIIMVIISGIELLTALAQAVICCSATCCKNYCFLRHNRAVTVIYNSCPEKKETDRLMERDVLERGDSTELSLDEFSSGCPSEGDCDEIFVIPGVHLDQKATLDNHRAMEEFEVDNKGSKKKKKTDR